MNNREKLEELEQIARRVFVPGPVGWYPRLDDHSEEYLQKLGFLIIHYRGLVIAESIDYQI